jgi:type III pantothenate kinase
MKTIVLIDSGNTRLKVGVIDGEADRRNGILGQALDNDDVQGLKDWLATLPSAPVAALGTNVAGAARAAAIEAALKDIGCPTRWIVPQAQAYGLTSRYTRPEQLGPDRWVSMLGVLAMRDVATPAFGGHAGTGDHAGSAGAIGLGGVHAAADSSAPFLLASFGTATTLDTVSGDGVFEGGLILPGPALMRQSLASGTANLPLVHGDATAFPTDTQQAISSGVVAAQAGAVLRQWLAGLQRYGTAPRIYAAGGGWREVEAETRRLLTDAASAMGSLPPPITVVENPVLYGLASIAATTNLGSS